MKKLPVCIFLFAAFIALAACQKQDAPKEDMYFISLPADTSREQFVLHYSGGSTIESVYAIPCDIFCLDDSRLYYADGKTIYSVELTSGKCSEYAAMPDKISKLAADSSGVYAMCRPLFGPDRHVIYKVTPTEYVRIDENGVLSNHGSMLADGGYLFYMDCSTAALMAYNSANGETSQIAEAVSGILDYDNGFVYANILLRTYKVDTKTGEQTFVQRGTSAPHDGFIYYAHQLFCESGNNLHEIFRRKGDDIELCGAASLPSMGFHELSDLISFGEYGFITQGINQFNPTEYTYFTYDGSENIVLTVE